MNIDKILKLKIMDADLREIGKVKSLEVINWKIIGIIANLNKEITEYFFGKSTFRIGGKKVILPTDLIKRVGDVVILKVSGPDLMIYSRLGEIALEGVEKIEKSINSQEELKKLDKKIEKEVGKLLKELDSLTGVSDMVRLSFKDDAESFRKNIMAKGYEKIGLDRN